MKKKKPNKEVVLHIHIRPKRKRKDKMERGDDKR